MRLTAAMRDLLWTVAQHKYGWAHCPNVGRERRFQVAEALKRRGLVDIDRSQPHMPTCSTTPEGRMEILCRWPVSPYILGTYEHQPGGWTPLGAEDDLMDDCMTPYKPGVNCLDCGRFVGRDGHISIDYFEMSNEVASVEGTCRRCIDIAHDREVEAERRHLTELTT